MRKAYLVLIFMTSLYSCNQDNCSKNIGFKLDYHLFDQINVGGKTYCELVNEALQGDVGAIANLSKVEVHDGATYQHGRVLIKVIEKLSETKYIAVLANFTDKEKKLVYYSLWAGLQYNSDSRSQKAQFVEIAFPQLGKYLK
jgi:hypothetical protein